MPTQSVYLGTSVKFRRFSLLALLADHTPRLVSTITGSASSQTSSISSNTEFSATSSTPALPASVSSSSTAESALTASTTSQLSATPSYNISLQSALWVPLNSTTPLNVPDLVACKFGGSTMAFRVFDNIDFPAPSTQANQDLQQCSVSDIETCMTLCTEYNINTPHKSDPGPFCQGAVFFNDGACWLKSGINDTSPNVTNTQAVAAILHFLS